jgi:hypothetical protein
MLQKVVASPLKEMCLNAEPVFHAGRDKKFFSLGRYFIPDPIPGDQGNSIFRHDVNLSSII